MKKKNSGTKCTKKTKKAKKRFRRKKSGKKVYDISFNGGDLTSDGGLVLLEKADKMLDLTKRLSTIIPDPRNPFYTKYSILEMLRQRIYGLSLGYEDLIDHKDLRKDKALQSVTGTDSDLASTSTLFRFEHFSDRTTMIAMHELLLDVFISSHRKPPKKIILDFDATDDPTHGNQEGSFYNGYYGNHCFLPLYVFCGDFPLVAYLRPSNEDGAKHSLAILSLLVKCIRKYWPETNIVFRGDSGFNRHKMFTWCEKNGIDYICGMGQNKRLEALSEPYVSKAKEYFDHTQEKQRIFATFEYGAKSWGKERHIILKAEHLPKGANPRYLVTNMQGDPQYLYEKVYCARGDMENRIKEQQLGLFADRTSCHDWWPNQFRLLLSTFAYVLIAHIRRVGLVATQFAKAQATTIRLKLLKIGAVVIKNTRRIRFLMSNSYPYKELFFKALARLTPS